MIIYFAPKCLRATRQKGEKANMAYQIFRVEKVKRQGVGGIQAEHNRTEKDNGRFPDSNIDYTKTKDNDYLNEKESRNYWEDIKKELAKKGITKWRKDAVVMIDAIYTASPEAFRDWSKDQAMAYFKECLEWHERKFGPVINAVIHHDETTPHLHVNSVPIKQKEDGSWKLCAKEMVGNKAQMSNLQTDLYQEVSIWKGLERGEVRDPDNQRKRKTKLQHDIEIMDNVIKNKIKEKEQLNSEIEPMRSEKAFYDSVIEDNRLLRDEVDEKEKKIKALSLKATENWNLYQGEKLKTSELEEKIKELVYGKEYDRTY